MIGDCEPVLLLRRRSTPFLMWFIFSTSVTSLWPIDFPFKILISGNHIGFQFIHPNYPFFQKIIQNPIIKPHTDRSMGRPAIIVMVVNGSVCYFIAFFTRKSPRKSQNLHKIISTHLLIMEVDFCPVLCVLEVPALQDFQGIGHFVWYCKAVSDLS